MINTNRYLLHSLPNQQQGVVLVFCLILLLVTSLLGITAMNTTSLEESMTRNERDRHTAFQAAEAALREGERYVLSQATSATAFVASFVDTCTNGLCTRREDSNSFLYSATSPSPAGNMTIWNSAGKYRSHANTSLINSKGITTTPKYIIEFVGYQGDGGTCSPGSPTSYCDELYRVTAFATGGTDDAKVMLQSLYQVSF